LSFGCGLAQSPIVRVWSQQGNVFAERIGLVARPRVPRGMAHHVGAQRIQLDVAVHRQQAVDFEPHASSSFFQFLPEIRKVFYTTNAIESLNMVMRKYTRNRRIFPNDDSALKSLFLAIREASKNWKSIHHWKPALQSFQVMFGEERVPLGAL